MAIDTIKAPPLIDDLKPGRFLPMLKFFGPGAIMASLTIGSGETFFASRGGAVFSYYIIWAFFLGCLFKWAQCYSAMRYLTLTGDHPINAWAHFPGPRGWFPFLIAVLSILCFPFWLAFLPSLLGDLCNWMFGFWPREVWGTIWLLIAIAMTILGGYSVLEKVQLVLVGVLIAVIIFSVFWFGPVWGAVLVSSVVPRIPDYAPWIVEKYPEVAARSPWVEVATYEEGSYVALQDHLSTAEERCRGALSEFSYDALNTASGVASAEDHLFAALDELCQELNHHQRGTLEGVTLTITYLEDDAHMDGGMPAPDYP